MERQTNSDLSQAKMKLNEQQLASLSSPKAVNQYLEHQKENITNLIKQNLAVGDIYRRENLQVACLLKMCPLYTYLFWSCWQQILSPCQKMEQVYQFSVICLSIKVTFAYTNDLCICVFCSLLPRISSKRLRIPLLNSNVKIKNMMRNGWRIRFVSYFLVCFLLFVVLAASSVHVYMQNYKYLELFSKWSM